MSDVVHVMHPAPVRHRRRGIRPGALGFVAVTTPVTLNVDDARTMRVVHRGRTGATPRAVYEGEGRLWTRLDHVRAGRDGKAGETVPLPLDRFLASLTGERGRPGHDLRYFMARSPLVAWHAPRHSNLFGWHGGERHGDEAQTGAKPASDGTDMAREALRGLIDRDVRVRGGQVFVPYEGGHLAVWQGHPSQRQVRFGLHATSKPAAFLAYGRPDAFLVPVSMEDEALLLARRILPAGAFEPQVHLPDDMPGIAGRPGDETSSVVAHANALPGRVLEWVSSSHPAALSSDLGRALAEWEMRGTIGAVREADAAEALMACSTAVRTLWDDGSNSPRTRMGAVVEYVHDIALPWLRERHPAPSRDDEAALGGLAP